jgi:hypothetical protein
MKSRTVAGGEKKMSYIYLFFSLTGHRFHGEKLAGVILNATEKNQGNGGSLLIQYLEDVLFSKDVFALSGAEF